VWRFVQRCSLLAVPFQLSSERTERSGSQQTGIEQQTLHVNAEFMTDEVLLRGSCKSQVLEFVCSRSGAAGHSWY